MQFTVFAKWFSFTSIIFRNDINLLSQSQWPRGLRRRFADARLLRSWVRIPPGAWVFVCCDCCVLSGRGLCYKLITGPEESYRLWCVVVCDLETSRMRRAWPASGSSATEKKINLLTLILLVWRIGWAPNNARKWQVGFNSAFKGLKSTCYVMPQQFNIQQLYALPKLYLCVLYLSENKQRLVPLTA